MGATRRRANQLAAAEGQAAREVAADHAQFSEKENAAAAAAAAGGGPAAAAAPPTRRRPARPHQQSPWWVGYLSTVVLSFVFWAFTRMLLRNQAFLSAHKHDQHHA